MKKGKELVRRYGMEILLSKGMNSEKNFIQHGSISCYEHSLRVAEKSVNVANTLHIKVDMPAMVRGALLHDYFLYDWHEDNPSHKLHGFSHAACALKNARRDFMLSPREQDIILRHMFPLNIKPPKYRESYIVCLSDKLCAIGEVFSERFHRRRRKYGGVKT